MLSTCPGDQRKRNRLKVQDKDKHHKNISNGEEARVSAYIICTGCELPAGRALKEETLLREGLPVYLTLRPGWETMMTSLEVLSRHTVPEAMKQSLRYLISNLKAS